MKALRFVGIWAVLLVLVIGLALLLAWIQATVTDATGNELVGVIAAAALPVAVLTAVVADELRSR